MPDMLLAGQISFEYVTEQTFPGSGGLRPNPPNPPSPTYGPV